MIAPTNPTAHPNVVLREELEEFGLLYHLDTGQALGLNPTGAAIWRLLDGTRSRDEIVRQLSAHYQASPETVGPEVDAFLAKLAGHSLLAEA